MFSISVAEIIKINLIAHDQEEWRSEPAWTISIQIANLCKNRAFLFRKIKISRVVGIILISNSLFSVNVESVGAMAPNVIFIEAVKILRNKCTSFLEELNKFD